MGRAHPFCSCPRSAPGRIRTKGARFLAVESQLHARLMFVLRCRCAQSTFLGSRVRVVRSSERLLGRGLEPPPRCPGALNLPSPGLASSQQSTTVVSVPAALFKRSVSQGSRFSLVWGIARMGSPPEVVNNVEVISSAMCKGGLWEGQHLRHGFW
jgi:hypothetical protein